MTDVPAPRAAEAGRVFMVVVDDSPEMSLALRFACRRARHTGGRVALLRVIDPVDFQQWNAVGDLMRAEARAEAEKLVQRLAAEVQEQTGQIPVVYLREGERVKTVLQVTEEEPAVSVLVLAASSGSDPGPIIGHLAKRNFQRMRVPVTIVPGNLTPDEIDALT
ncbi:MAG: universal stress protein [Alphaproteobacteria bacterium]|nr:universal stress protein [Alphaproteobacteria bacterium]